MKRGPAAAALGVESTAKYYINVPVLQTTWVASPGAHTPALVLNMGCLLAWVVPSSSFDFLCELGRWNGGRPSSSPPMIQSIILSIHGILLCPCFILPRPWIMQKYDSHWADEDIRVRKEDRILLRSCSQMGTPGGGLSSIPQAQIFTRQQMALWFDLKHF